MLVFANCQTLDANEPIVLVPDDDWTETQVQILRNVAECWNMKYGTRLYVGRSDTTMQQVKFSFHDYTCLFGGGRTETNLPVRVSICRPSWYIPSDNAAYLNGVLATVLLHELGHVLNIRKHASERGSVMAASADEQDGQPEFSKNDDRLFFEANPDFRLTPSCQQVDVIGSSDGLECYCRD